MPRAFGLENRQLERHQTLASTPQQDLHGQVAVSRTNSSFPSMDEDNQIISRYTRAQAIEDGVLVDVTEEARETGLLLPTVITDHVHHTLDDFPKASVGQDIRGRLQDVLC